VCSAADATRRHPYAAAVPVCLSISTPLYLSLVCWLLAARGIARRGCHYLPFIYYTLPTIISAIPLRCVEHEDSISSVEENNKSNAG